MFEARPEWSGHVIADLNFELLAHAHSTRDAVRCTYEYADFVRGFVDAVQMPKGIYPEGMTTLYPIETWSDDFTMAISGIPSMVNDFSGGPFMENYYHSQYDNQDVYEEEVYKFHHEFYLRLLLAIDSLALPPMDFGRALAGSIESLDLDLCMQTGANGVLLLEKTEEAKKQLPFFQSRCAASTAFRKKNVTGKSRCHHRKASRCISEIPGLSGASGLG